MTPSPPSTEPEDSMSRLMQGPSAPLATAALLLGLIALLLAFFTLSGGFAPRTVDPAHPPSLLAVNLSFFAMFLGVASLYRVRRLSRQTLTRLAALAGLLLGLAGPIAYSYQALQWRKAMQQNEEANVQAIVAAARRYADAHDGLYPSGLATLLSSGLLTPERLWSPFPAVQTTGPLRSRAERAADRTPEQHAADSDYEYVGAGLRSEMARQVPDFASKAVVVFAREPRMKAVLTVGFADGAVKFLHPEEVGAALVANNEVREKVGLPKLGPPRAMATQPAP